MRVLVMMPIYRSMDAHCVISLVDFIQGLHHDGHFVKMVFTNGFNAAKARKALAQHAAENEKDYDYVLWLDSDHAYKTKDFYKLRDQIELEKLGMLSASYTLHGSPETAHGITDEEGFRHFKPEDLNGNLIDCTVVGFGFLLMKASFIKNMWEKFKDELFILDAKENCTEDVTFCKCVLDDGGRVCFDPSVKVGHLESAIRY